MKRRPSLRFWMALSALALVPSLADAGPSRVGPSFNVSGTTTSKRSDVAYDPVNDVYLAVSGQLGASPVYGRFVGGDGAILGVPFALPTAGASQMPRVAYSSDVGGFLVVWQDLRANPEVSNIWGRFVKYAGGGAPAWVGNDFFIDNAAGGAMSQSPPAVTCAGGKGECLVAWSQIGGGAEAPFDIHAIRVTTAGPVAPEIFLTNDADFEDEVSLGYDPASGNYLAAWMTWREAAQVAQIEVSAVQSGTGAVPAGRKLIAQHGSTHIPQVALNPRNGQFLVTWYTGDSGQVFYGRFVDNLGTIVTGSVPLLVGFGGYDAFGIAFNPVSNTYLATTHGQGSEDIGFEVSGQGVPATPLTLTGLGGNKGNFYPRVAAHGARPEWLLTTSSSFAFIGGQRITTDTQGGGGGNPGNPGRPPSETITLQDDAVSAGNWYLAEGAANASPNGYQTWYLISNPNPVPVKMRVYYSAEDGYTIKKEYDIPFRSRMSLNLQNEAGAGSYGTVFQSLGGLGYDIQVERSVYWGPNMEGSTGAAAVKFGSNRWMFAEGSRGGEKFNNYFMLYNPNQATATVSITFYLADGSAVGKNTGIGPQQRVTVDANSFPELAGKDFATVIESTGAAIVAERAMYWGWGGANLWIGGTESMGATSLNSRWYFAEGAAAIGYQTYYMLWNPGATAITVDALYRSEFGGTQFRQYTVNAHSRKTVELNTEVGNVGGVAAEFASTGAPFLVERSSYWGSNGWVEGVNVVGTPGIATEWFLPEGTTGGLFKTYLLLLNPHAINVPVNITIYLENGAGQYTLAKTLPASSRTTIDMADFLRDAGAPAGSSFATRVGVIQGNPGVVAEHAIYWNADPGNFFRAGAGAVGIPTVLQPVH